MWDGIIIGGGLAGLIAGIRASQRGKRILIISEGVGSLTYSSGIMDFGDVDRLLCQEQHPYALLGEPAVRSGMDYFLTLFSDYEGKWRDSQEVLTPLGSPRRAGLVSKGQKAEVLRDAQRIVLVSLEGMKDFFPEVIKANLERAYPQGKVEEYPVRVATFEAWHVLGKSVTGMDYAKYWRSVPGIAMLSEVLKRLAQEMDLKSQSANERGKTVVVFPGLASGFSKSLDNLLSESSFPVVEMTAFPPSASGQILYEALKEKFRALGGELLVGSGVKRVQRQGKLCHKVIVKSKGKDSEFAAHSFVLATGGIFGGGLEVTPDSQKEIVFELPLYVPAGWTRAEFLGEQPYARMGIEVDRELRPIEGQSQDVILENVKVIGRTLAHWDPWVEHCGGGVSLASGWFAGETI